MEKEDSEEVLAAENRSEHQERQEDVRGTTPERVESLAGLGARIEGAHSSGDPSENRKIYPTGF